MGRCVQAAGLLAANTAGLVEASARVTDQCAGKPAAQVVDRFTNLGFCFGHVGASAKSLLASGVTIEAIAKKTCKGHQCITHLLALVDVLSEFGAAFAGAFDRCDQAGVQAIGTTNPQAECARGVFQIINSLAGFAHHGYIVAKECKIDKSLLYYSDHEIGVSSNSVASGSSSLLTWGLAAAIPLAFLGGMRISKSRVLPLPIRGEAPYSARDLSRTESQVLIDEH
jgi:hypothetical protein